MSLPGKLLFSAIRHHKRIAAIDDNRRYTYGQIAGGAMFIAEQIDQVTDCPRVGLLLPTSGAFPMLLLGTWLAGRVAVPLNYLLSADELRYVIEDAGIETIISAGPMLEFLKDLPSDSREIIQQLKEGRVKIEFEHVGLEPARKTI
ncbi:MAG: class I adenylate-forming enzyme family protein, partial [Phycisphaeraceae bacterium]|nr:class I adenylate-forming enzyme family protein [Phycisphaeraceae bacterium]